MQRSYINIALFLILLCAFTNRSARRRKHEAHYTTTIC